MKRAAGIGLMIIGSMMFLFCGYGFVTFLTTDREKFIARYEQKGQDANSFYKEGIDNHIQHGRLKTGLLTLLGAGMIVAGYRLVRKSVARQNGRT